MCSLFDETVSSLAGALSFSQREIPGEILMSLGIHCFNNLIVRLKIQCLIKSILIDVRQGYTWTLKLTLHVPYTYLSHSLIFFSLSLSLL